MDIYFDSHKLSCRKPCGAVRTGGQARLMLRMPDGVRAKLRLWTDGGERIVEGRINGSLAEFAFTADAPGLIWYYFILETPSGTKWLGPREPAFGGEGAVYDYAPPSWQLTVYDGGYKTPTSFAGGLVYQIFPDRFARSARDDVSRYGHHLAMKRPLYIHKNWDEEVLFRPVEGNEYDPCDYFGGDLAGVEERLPYLKSLGVTAIYLNPIFEASSNHRYNTADYMSVDPMLGGEAALISLVRAANKLGIRLMLDGVFSHTGDDSVYFDRRGVYSGDGAYRTPSSPYKSWYDFFSWPDSYRCWWGFKTLPEVNEADPSYMEYIGRVIDRYAALGVTSWRLDVADELPDEFIAFLRERVKRNDPEGVLVGEVWEDASNKVSGGGRRRYVDGHELDGVMNYPFRDALCDFLLFRCDSAGLCRRLESLRENYPPPFYDACITELGSHDTVRIFTVLSGAPHRDALTREEQAAYSPRPDAAARGRARLILAATVQLSSPGVPCIYYGDEAGLTGMADPFNRATYPWGHEDEHILSRYRLLTAARLACPAMRTPVCEGGLCAFASPDPEVFAMLRNTPGSCALVLVNRSEQARRISISASDFTDGPDAGRLHIAPALRDVLTDSRIYASDGKINIVLPPISGALLTDC